MTVFTTVRSIKTPLDQTHVYSIESKDRLAPFGVMMFLYHTIGDGRNTGVLRVLILTMSSELLKKIHNNLDTFYDFD